jgi:rod shape-determining protein MreC
MILALSFFGLSALMLVMPSVAQERVASTLRGSVLAPFLQIQESILGARVLSQTLGELQSQLDSAYTVVQSRSTLDEENRRLRSLLGLRERGGPSFLPASAMRSGMLGSESMFILDVGRDQGVEVHDPVVVSAGLVGVVREVGGRFSLAMDWTHPDFRASAMTIDGEVFGIVESRHGAFREEDRLMLNGVPFQTSVEDGVSVVTSGRGAAYPRGILIGTVAGLAEVEAGWRRSYWIDPAIRPGSATHVLVVTARELLGEEALESLLGPSEEMSGQDQ